MNATDTLILCVCEQNIPPIDHISALGCFDEKKFKLTGNVPGLESLRLTLLRWKSKSNRTNSSSPAMIYWPKGSNRIRYLRISSISLWQSASSMTDNEIADLRSLPSDLLPRLRHMEFTFFDDFTIRCN